MNIAHLLPATARFPLTKHNGRYEWALRLAVAEAEAGHTVTVYCAEGSYGDTSPIHWESVVKPDDNQVAKGAHNQALMKKAFANIDHDVFHSHFDSLHYRLANETDKPIIVTQHWFPNDAIAATAHQYPAENIFVVPVTKYMKARDAALDITASEVIYHGIDLELFKPSSTERSDRLIFVGRIAPHKGVKEIVVLAQKAGQALDIYGKINEPDMPYWQSILPYVDGETIRYHGPVARSDVPALFSSAKAFVFSPQLIEAFGQVIVEAQACGTPVITTDKGAAHELLEPHKTGFLFTNQKEFNAAVRDAKTLDPKACRQFATRFDEREMVDKYLALYQRVSTS